MKIDYKKDLRHNYMVLEVENYATIEPYCLRILEQRSLPGVLPFEVKRIDNKVLFYYEITAKQSLITILDRTVLTNDQLRKLCLGIFKVMEDAYDYLLPEEGFVLSPQYIYLDIASHTPYLFYLPGYGTDIGEQMNSLMEYLMNKIDYSDKEAVVLVYQLYAVCRESGFVYSQLMELLLETSKDLSTHEETQNKNHQISPDERKKSTKDKFQKLKLSKEPKLSNIQEEKRINDAIKSIGAAQATDQNKVQKIFDNKYKEDNPKDLDIPVVIERIEGEAEKACYSIKTYLCSIGCILGGVIVILGCMFTKILFNSFGNRIDYSKLFLLILIVLCMEGYLMNKLLDKKNRITKMVKTIQYVDPMQVELSPRIKSSKDQDLKTYSNLNPSSHLVKDHNYEISEEEDINPTCLLSASSEEKAIILKSQGECNDIRITNYPFFVGKIRSNVDYCLEKDVVSRFHAKITKENNQFYLTDLNSTNGTFVNNEVLQTYEKREIKFGDEVAFANIKFQFIAQ